MKTKHLFLIITLVLLVSCQNNNQNKLVTKKIQYDVNIKSLNKHYDPWIENISKQNRLTFVQKLLDKAYAGEIEVYDYFNKPLSKEQLNSLGVDTIYKTLTRAYPPYEDYDTIIVNKYSIRDINKIRFLEEWSMNEKNLVFKKTVIGVAPIIDKYDQNGNFLGKQPLFWIYPDGKPE